MKKTLIAGAAASVAMAALPMAGVFANVTDTVTLTVGSSCTMATENSSTGKTVNLGSQNAGSAFGASNGTPMTITCNDADGWTLSASVTALSASGVAKTIPFGAYSEAGNSVWSAAISLDQTGLGTAASIATGWNDYSATAGGTILSGAAGTAVANLVVTPSYKAYADAAQPAGTYSGTIEFAFAAN